MSQSIHLTIDGVQIAASPGQTILDAAQEAGIFIPRLCAMEGLTPHGSCRICTVRTNGRPQAACTQPVAEGMVIENNTEELNALRRNILEMLLVEGNHFCMFCEKSGNCELQALAYRYGITVPKYPYLFPEKQVDASHPNVFIDRNRCVMCARCIRTSREIDGKVVFEFVGRSAWKKVAVDSEDGLVETDLSATDKAVSACPVGAMTYKHQGYTVPVGKRQYDHQPIGSDLKKRKKIEVTDG